MTCVHCWDICQWHEASEAHTLTRHFNGGHQRVTIALFVATKQTQFCGFRSSAALERAPSICVAFPESFVTPFEGT